MASVLSRMFSPAPLLYTFVVITQFAYGAYLGAQLHFSKGVTIIFAVGMLWWVGWWLRTDSRRRGVLSVYDLGFFLYLAWPVVMPYYLLKTRGANGLLVMLGLWSRTLARLLSEWFCRCWWLRFACDLSDDAEQIAGRERRERVSHNYWSGDAFVNSRWRVNSTVGCLT